MLMAKTETSQRSGFPLIPGLSATAMLQMHIIDLILDLLN